MLVDSRALQIILIQLFKTFNILDFRDAGAYRKEVVEFNPDYLFHIGAFTDLEYCELHEEDTYKTNTESVKHAVDTPDDLVRLELLMQNMND